MDTKETLTRKLEGKTARVAVLGMGYVGLPLAVVFAEAGFHVTGIDPDGRKIDALCKGESYIPDVSSAQVAKLVESGRLAASTDFSALAEMDAVSICVPTPLRQTGDPDMSFILSAVDELAKYMHAGMVVVLESTTYPGTTREVLLPKLGEERGLQVGQDWFLAFSPERVDPGREDFTTLNTPKVVGGITPACCDIAAAWYGGAIQHIQLVSSAEAAEMAKLLENTFRMVNIGMVNEMAIMCERMGVDVWEVIDAAATKPFGFMRFYPGPGLGGHCIPIDPHYLSWKLKSLNYYARFIELAGDINSHMPEYVVQRIDTALNTRKLSINGAKVLILGVAYKRDVSDLRESPSLDIIRILQEKGARVSYCDQFVPVIKLDHGPDLKATPLNEKILKSNDCVAIVTDHSYFNYQWIVDNAPVVVDTRNATKNVLNGRRKIFKI